MEKLLIFFCGGQESALRTVKEQLKQVGELLKSWVDGCLIQNCFVGHRKGNPLLS